ncbi:hypothetical protein ACLB2K_006566 [Fragaria x ananassa]
MSGNILSTSFNSHVFVLDPSTGNITTDPSFPKPYAVKTNPRALATIDQKGYVLSTSAYYYRDEVLPNPAFEYFNIVENRWEALPAPPFYDEHP